MIQRCGFVYLFLNRRLESAERAADNVLSKCKQAFRTLSRWLSLAPARSLLLVWPLGLQECRAACLLLTGSWNRDSPSKIQSRNNVPRDEGGKPVSRWPFGERRMMAYVMIPIYCIPSRLARTVQPQHSVLVQAQGFEIFSLSLMGLSAAVYCGNDVFTWHWSSCSTAGVAKYEGSFLKVEWKHQGFLSCPNSGKW